MPMPTGSAPPAKELHLSFRSGPFRSAFRPPGSPRLSRAERDASVAAMNSARVRALAGDDADLRHLSLERFVVECVTETGQYTGSPRKRKFSNPLFLTPDGMLHAFPENDKDLFSMHEVALDSLKKSADGHWEIRQTTLEAELRKKPYLRWVREVKGHDYQEPRRTEAELLTIYENGGRDALLKLYSKAHAFKIAKRLKAALANT